jgi:hypothetical protein
VFVVEGWEHSTTSDLSAGQGTDKAWLVPKVKAVMSRRYTEKDEIKDYGSFDSEE